MPPRDMQLLRRPAVPYEAPHSLLPFGALQPPVNKLPHRPRQLVALARIGASGSLAHYG